MGILGSKEATREILGNKAASNVMLVQFCGGGGYKKHAESVQREVEKMHPRVFKYILAKDASVTGRLEVSVGPADGDEAEYKVVHSKKAGNGYPHNDWESFHDRLDASMRSLKQGAGQLRAPPHWPWLRGRAWGAALSAQRLVTALPQT